MLSGATYCHWNLHITRCERYKKRISKNVSQIVVKKYVQTNIQEQPIAIGIFTLLVVKDIKKEYLKMFPKLW
jgi:hypothetical protein